MTESFDYVAHANDCDLLAAAIPIPNDVDDDDDDKALAG